MNGECVSLKFVPETNPDGTPAPVIKTVRCGSAPSNTGTTWDFALCGNEPHPCYSQDGRQASVDTFASVQQDPAGGEWAVLAFWCPSQLDPMPNASGLREQALRLLPSVAIGTTDARALVNIQTILWADTVSVRDLGTVTITGRQVRLRATVERLHWDFGDGSAEDATTPGERYDRASAPCATKQCPGYFGHTYDRSGPVTITLTITWRAAYSLDGSTFQPIGTDALPGPPVTTGLTLMQARGVLVPND